jgi:MFS family permease
MFVALRSAVRADIDRQIGWAKDQLKRQTRYTALMAILAGVAALAALGAVIVGLIALHSWVAMQTGPFIAHGVIGAGLLLLALILFALALIRRRPRLAARPPLQIAQPAALLGGLRQGSYDKVVTGGEQTLKLASGALRDGSRSTLLGTLALVVAVGLLVGRRLRDHRTVRQTL